MSQTGNPGPISGAMSRSGLTPVPLEALLTQQSIRVPGGPDMTSAIERSTSVFLLPIAASDQESAAVMYTHIAVSKARLEPGVSPSAPEALEGGPAPRVLRDAEGRGQDEQGPPSGNEGGQTPFVPHRSFLDDMHGVESEPPSGILGESLFTTCRRAHAWMRRKAHRGRGGPGMGPHEAAVESMDNAAAAAARQRAREYSAEEHMMSIPELAAKFSTSLDEVQPARSHGLEPAEAGVRLAIHGKNVLTPPKTTPEWVKFLKQFTNLLMVLLIIASGLGFLAYGLVQTSGSSGGASDNLILGCALLVIVTLTCCMSYWQERQASDVIASIRGMLPSKCKVVRGGKECITAADLLVPGDVVHLTIGNRIPADIRVISSNDLKVEMSSLTGESDAVECGPVKMSDLPVESHCLIFNSCLIMNGDCYGVVYRTGDNSMIGQIAAMSSSTAGARRTTLELEVHRLVVFIALLAIVTAIIFFVIGLARGYGIVFSFVNAFILVLVANVPEGLPASVTSMLTLAARSLATHNVFIKRTDLIETLGCATVICSDKTGTLTQNKMSVSQVWVDGKVFNALGKIKRVHGAAAGRRGGGAERGTPAPLDHAEEERDIAAEMTIGRGMSMVGGTMFIHSRRWQGVGGVDHAATVPVPSLHHLVSAADQNLLAARPLSPRSDRPGPSMHAARGVPATVSEGEGEGGPTPMPTPRPSPGGGTTRPRLTVTEAGASPPSLAVDVTGEGAQHLIPVSVLQPDRSTARRPAPPPAGSAQAAAPLEFGDATELGTISGISRGPAWSAGSPGSSGRAGSTTPTRPTVVLPLSTGRPHARGATMGSEGPLTLTSPQVVHSPSEAMRGEGRGRGRPDPQFSTAGEGAGEATVASFQSFRAFTRASWSDSNAFTKMVTIAAVCNKAKFSAGEEEEGSPQAPPLPPAAPGVASGGASEKPNKSSAQDNWEEVEGGSEGGEAFQVQRSMTRAFGGLPLGPSLGPTGIRSLLSKTVPRPQGRDVRRVLGDASEAALLRYSDKFVPILDFQLAYPVLFEIPFNSTNKWAYAVCPCPEDPNTHVAMMKGAPEKLLDRCSHHLKTGVEEPIDKDFKAQWAAAYERFGLSGERVLAFAYRTFPAVQGATSVYKTNEGSRPMHNLVFVGLVSLIDPPKEGVPQAVATCREAGIRVTMVTGDHPLTAEAIARKVGIITLPTGREIAAQDGVDEASISLTDPRVGAVVLPGYALPELAESDWDAILSKTEVVFARTSPQQKLDIVTHYQRLGHVVAVTGDGTNDAPALKKADMGIAMGSAGASDVAREAADMVLTDDNFASIVVAITMGRTVFDNIRKTIAYTVAHAIPELLPVFVLLLLDVPLMLTGLLVLSIDLITEQWPAISLAWEPSEAAVMKRPPRDRKVERLVDGRLIRYSYLIIGVSEFLICCMAYFLTCNYYGIPGSALLNNRELWTADSPPLIVNGVLYTGEEQETIWRRGVAAYYLTLLLCQGWHVFLTKTRTVSLFTQGPFINPQSAYGVCFAIAVGCFVVYVPGVQDLFDCRNPSFWPWVCHFAFAAIFVPYTEASKQEARRNPKGWWARNMQW